MPPDREHPDYPSWLRPLVTAAERVRPEELSRFLPPADGGRPSAVLALFGEGPAGPDVLLIQRADELRSHAGQPAFPGGMADPGDAGPEDTALREAAEEVGLDPAGVRIVARLPALYLPPSNFVVTPVLGWWHTSAAVGVVDPAEVARVERVPVAELVDPANRCRMRHPSSGFAGPAFLVRDMVVWGFTAGLLDRLLTLGGWAVPWDVDDLRDLPQRVVDLTGRGVPPGYRLPPDQVPAHDAPAADDVIPRADGLATGGDGGPVR
jgi:8-oxo-dGTP pyrophosphatase MutT (NUDIX family)